MRLVNMDVINAGPVDRRVEARSEKSGARAWCLKSPLRTRGSVVQPDVQIRMGLRSAGVSKFADRERSCRVFLRGFARC